MFRFDAAAPEALSEAIDKRLFTAKFGCTRRLCATWVPGEFLEQQRSGPRYPADPGVRCSTPIGPDNGRQSRGANPVRLETILLPAQTDLTTGDLVAFSFPFSGRGSKTRTCAVVHHDHACNELVVAYGTSNLDLRANSKFAVVVESTDALAQAGLHRPARLGSLSSDTMQQLINCYAKLPAVAEDAERVGIHPKPSRRGGRRRTAFLGCRLASQQFDDRDEGSERTLVTI